MLVSSGIHLRRGLIYFAHFGVGATPVRADYLRAVWSWLPLSYNFVLADLALHEYTGIARYHVYNAMGWNAARTPPGQARFSAVAILADATSRPPSAPRPAASTVAARAHRVAGRRLADRFFSRFPLETLSLPHPRIPPPISGRGRIGDIAVVPVPPLVGRGLGIACGESSQTFLAAQRRDVQVFQVLPICSSPRLLSEVGEIDAVRRRGRTTLVPCHSCTPASASKLSVKVNQGIAHPIRSFSLAISGCGARGTAPGGCRGRSGERRWATWSATMGAAPAGVIRPAVHARLEECAVDDQLAAAIEQVESG